MRRIQLSILCLAYITNTIAAKKDEEKDQAVVPVAPSPKPTFEFATLSLGDVETITDPAPPPGANPTPDPTFGFATLSLGDVDIISASPSASGAPSSSDSSTPAPVSPFPTGSDDDGTPAPVAPVSPFPTTIDTPNPTSLAPTTPAPTSASPTTLAPITPAPTTAEPSTFPPSPAPNSPPPTPILNNGDINCYIATKQECKDANNCVWTRSDESGELSCEFVTGAPTPYVTFSSLSLEDGTEDSSSPTSSAAVAENCYVLSLSESQCLAATNCEWVYDDVGKTLCQTKPIVVDNCYVLSLNKGECLYATNCEWTTDVVGNTVCQNLVVPSGSGTPNGTPFPSYGAGDGVGLVQNEIILDCSTITKEECKLSEGGSGDCVWNKNTNLCDAVTTSPTLEPSRYPTEGPSESPMLPTFDPSPRPSSDEPSTLRPTNDPTISPSPPPTTDRPTISPTLRPSSLSPTEKTSVNCLDPDVTKEDCRDTEYCVWDKNSCSILTLEPTTSPPTTSPTPVDCLNPDITKEVCKASLHCLWNKNECFAITDSPTVKPTERPSVGPTLSPVDFVPTESPSVSPTRNPTVPPTSSPSTSVPPSHVPSLSPTVSIKPSISNQPSPSPTFSPYPTLGDYEYERPRRNDVRYVPWNKLDRGLQILATEELRYSKETWDNMGTNPIEQLRWDDLSDKQKEASMQLGFEDEVSWNCWQNHWESFSWKQLFSLKLTPHLNSLGWDINSWNSQYTDPPMTRKKDWIELTPQQHANASQLCYYKTSYDRLDIPTYGYGYPIEKPTSRFVEWKDIDESVRSQLEQSLGYDELTWNVLRLNEVEQKGWFEFFYYEKDIATSALGLDADSWDCWINHYDSYGWGDLVNKGFDVHMKGLGWSELSWNEEIDAPASDSKSWNELNETEQLHATELCFNEETWDMHDMTSHGGPFPFAKPKTRFRVWQNLSPEERRIAQNVFLYEERTWNDMGLADIEKRAWDDLTEYQRPYAVDLGLYQRTWDCFQNHYRATKWEDLSEEVSSAATKLGWDESRWSRWGEEPASYRRKWSQLNSEEKTAAHVICHFDVTWPGDGAAINLINQRDPDSIVNGGTHTCMNLLLVPSVMVSLVMAVLV